MAYISLRERASMSVMMALTREQEQQLRRAAQGRGMDADARLRELLSSAFAQLESDSAPSPTRVLGLHAGQTWISDDFDAPLPDAFWLGAE